MMDGVARRGARPAVGSRDEDLVRAALATPVAMVPTPASDTSLTETRA